MFKKFATAIALTATALVATPALADQPASTAELVYKVQAEAAWQGVEVSRIQRNGDRLIASGTDRQARDVNIDMTCKQLALSCRTNSMMASSKQKAPGAVSGMSATSGQ